MSNVVVVRITIASLLVLAINISALYFLLLVVLLNTHHQEFFGW